MTVTGNWPIVQRREGVQEAMGQLPVTVADEPDLPELVAYLAESGVANVPGNGQMVLSHVLDFL